MTDESVPYDRATTGQKSHRYLRLSLVFIVVALLTGVLIQSVTSGTWLPSISHYFYTPAHTVFVSSLIAASLALIALSGRDRDALAGRNTEPILLDIAAVFAPLIAIIPTGITAKELLKIPGSSKELFATYGVKTEEDLAKLQGWCSEGDAECVPAIYMPGIHVSLWTYIAVALAIVILSLWVHREKLWDTKHRQTRRAESPAQQRKRLTEFLAAPFVALVAALVVVLLAFVWPGEGDGAFPFNFPVIASVHYAVALLFFGTFAAVPFVNYLRYRKQPKDPLDQHPLETRISAAVGRLYLAIPILMALDLIALILVGVVWKIFPWVLIGEAGALVLFALFWAVQTVQWWHEPNSPYRVTTEGEAASAALQ